MLSPATPFIAKDSKDYPLRVEILWNKWDRYRPRPRVEPETFFYRVNGQGNLMAGTSIHAVDFKYEEMFVARSTAPHQTYSARWKKPDHQMELLVPEVGHEGKFQTLTIETTVREGVYLGRGSGIHEVSQADYATRQARTEAAAASQSEQQPASTSNVSVTSSPGSAEIQVDGEFVGMTPSVLQLTLGEHTIALHKASYKPWERTMKVVAGEIRMNADLEPATAN